MFGGVVDSSAPAPERRHGRLLVTNRWCHRNKNNSGVLERNDTVRNVSVQLFDMNSKGYDFATESNEVVVLRKGGDIVMEASGSKLSVADRILDVIA